MSELIHNEALIIPFCAWAVAQVMKVFVCLAREGHLELHYIISSGGMPSSHTALVCALATAVAMLEGVSSPFFAISVVLATIVMYDAAGVRQVVKNQSIVLNHMLEELFKGRPISDQRLRELIGHTFLEVVAGATLGIFIAWLWITISH